MLSSFRTLGRVALVSPLLLLAACTETPSSELATNEIDVYLRVEVLDEFTTTDLTVQFSQSITSEVVLAEGDVVTASTDKDPSVAFTLGGGNFYRASVPAVDRTTATFSLARATGTAAPDSTVAIPAALTLTAPLVDAEVPYEGGNGKLTLSWSNKVDGALIAVHADPCEGTATTNGPDLPDTGSYELSTKDMFVGAPAKTECIQLRVTRTIAGKIDPAFRGGTLEASRAMEIQVQLVP